MLALLNHCPMNGCKMEVVYPIPNSKILHVGPQNAKIGDQLRAPIECLMGYHDDKQRKVQILKFSILRTRYR
jgi:hypothetical protein